MNAKDTKRLRRRKRRIARRLDRNNFPREPGPVFKASNVRYEVSDRMRATPAGGVAAAHMLATRVGLPEAINDRLRLLKRHAPYYESDLRMEFKRFLNAVIRIPCQVLTAARRTVVRILAYTDRARLLFESLEATGRLEAKAAFDTS